MLANNLKILEDMWSRKNPNYNHLRSFGCKTCAHVPWKPSPKVGFELFTGEFFLGIRPKHEQSFPGAIGGHRGGDHFE